MIPKNLVLNDEIKAWFHDLWMAGGGVLPSDHVRPEGYGLWYEGNNERILAYAKIICDEIAKREFDPKHIIDEALEAVSNELFVPNVHASVNNKTSPDAKWITPEEAAAYIAVVCKHLNIVWDDRKRTSKEVRYFVQTMLGQALAQYGCFVSDFANIVF